MRHPEIFDQMADEIASAVLAEMADAAECNALPGFEGDPRGATIVEMWRRSRLGGDCLTEWAAEGTMMLLNKLSGRGRHL